MRDHPGGPAGSQEIRPKRLGSGWPVGGRTDTCPVVKAAQRTSRSGPAEVDSALACRFAQPVSGGTGGGKAGGDAADQVADRIDLLAPLPQC